MHTFIPADQNGAELLLVHLKNCLASQLLVRRSLDVVFWMCCPVCGQILMKPELLRVSDGLLVRLQKNMDIMSASMSSCWYFT